MWFPERVHQERTGPGASGTTGFGKRVPSPSEFCPDIRDIAGERDLQDTPDEYPPLTYRTVIRLDQVCVPQPEQLPAFSSRRNREPWTC